MGPLAHHKAPGAQLESPLEARSGPKRAGGSTGALRCGQPVPHQSAHKEPCPNDHHFRCSAGSDSSCPQSSASATPFPAGPSPVQLSPTPGLQSRFSPAKHGQQLAWPRPRCPPAPPPHPLQSRPSPRLASPRLPSLPLLSLPFPPARRPPLLPRLRQWICSTMLRRRALPATHSGPRGLHLPRPSPEPPAGAGQR